MYGHGICTLALTEAYGMMDRDTDNREIRKALELAIRLILKSQIKSDTPHRGGWRYEPTSQDADLSVAVWQILALRGAQNCRLDVPESAIRDALDYVRRCYSAPARGFCYQAGQNAASPAMRVAGVVCMLALGADETDEDKRKIADSASVLQQDILPQSKHFFYTAYYWMTAANMLETPETAAVLAKAEQFIAKLQTDNGSFQNYKDFDGDVYSTAFALICLSVRQQYLPIYQE
jgi:hypothetical protein